MENNFLFCNHPLYPGCVDEDYKDEYEAARLNFACALFSYEDMQVEKLSLFGDSIQGMTIYRGWMMPPKMYQKFYELLKNQGIILINSPEEYNTYHLLPGWYRDFEKYTPQSIWSDTGNIEDILLKASELEGSYIVKDYVKSRKHEWFDACFIKDIQDKSDAMRVINNFINRQADNLVGGVVLRKYENLKQTGFHEKSGMPVSEEYRVFVYFGRILDIGNYWNDKAKMNLSKEEMVWIETIAKRVKSNFVTVDFARKADGHLIIMEMGDGQVSGLQQINENTFYENLKRQSRLSF